MAAWSSCWLLTSNYVKIKSYDFAVEQNDRVRSDHGEATFVRQEFTEKFFVLVALILKVVHLLVDNWFIDLSV